MKKAITLILIAEIFMLFSCEIDNYDLPDKTIEGKIVDQVTGENLYTQQPNGIKVRLLEEGFSNPIPFDFWAMSDGTFRNTKVFAAKYKALVLEGPFEDSSVEQVDVNLTSGNQTIEFKVEPYVRLKNVNITVAGTTVNATYNIEHTTSSKVPTRCYLMLHNSVIVHQTTVGLKRSTQHNLTTWTIEEIEAETFEDQITGLAPGTYYARVGVHTNNTLNRVNYSPIVKVTIN